MAGTFFLIKPARRITVSGSLDGAIETLISRFVANNFRLTSKPGVYPATLSYGSLLGSVFLWDFSLIPGPLGRLLKYARVEVGRDPRSANSLIVMLVEGSGEFELISIFRRAIDGSLAAFQEAGVLTKASELVSAKDLLDA